MHTHLALVSCVSEKPGGAENTVSQQQALVNLNEGLTFPELDFLEKCVFLKNVFSKIDLLRFSKDVAAF